ncbi:MAG: hypothetical protein HOH65_00360 [Rhodospirillaceae bacterium]|nr:hypothetical protein [Rhodospirillaceae bacterium]
MSTEPRTNTVYANLTDNDPNITTERFAAILGLNPSKGARSPLLWNAAFRRAGLDAEMVPMDVRPENLANLVTALKADDRYLGGAVAVPHKQGLVDLLDRLEPKAQAIGAVNAIYRDGGQLVGANTDGEASLSALQKQAGDISGRNALLIGLGGAGGAVATYFTDAVGRLTLANRTQVTATDFAMRLSDQIDVPVDVIDLPPSADLMAKCDLLINCSSVGHEGGAAASASPLGAESEALLAAMPAGSIVYDIIYQPLQTPLLTQSAARGLTSVNGLAMNLDQAVIAFDKANPGALAMAEIRNIMTEAGKQG